MAVLSPATEALVVEAGFKPFGLFALQQHPAVVKDWIMGVTERPPGADACRVRTLGVAGGHRRRRPWRPGGMVVRRYRRPV